MQWVEVVLAWRWGPGSWAGGPNLKSVLAFLSWRRWQKCTQQTKQTHQSGLLVEACVLSAEPDATGHRASDSLGEALGKRRGSRHAAPKGLSVLCW